MRHTRLYRFCLSLCIGLLAYLFSHFLFWEEVVQAAQPSSHQEMLGWVVASNNKDTTQQDKALLQYNSGQYQEAIKLWNEALKQTSDKKTLATLHTNLGSAYRQVGNLGQAIQAWEEAIKIYKSSQDKETTRLLAQVLTEQAQAYNALGQSRTAVPILESAIEKATKHKDSNTLAAAYGALGNAHLALGEFDAAIASNKKSLEFSRSLKNSAFIATALNNLGNVYSNRYQRYSLQANSVQQEGDDKEVARLNGLMQQDLVAAKQAYEQSIDASRATGGIQQAKAMLNRARISELSEPSSQDKINQYRSEAMVLLDSVPDSRSKAYALINLAESLSASDSQLKIQNLEKAIATSRHLSDQRAESFALTALGAIYEKMGNLAKAMELTQQAQFAAQQVYAADSLYRAQAQAGRIYNAQGQREAAITSYRGAIGSLQSIRGDIAVASKDLQFDLRDSVEPVYRELMALLLEDGEKVKGQGESKIKNQKSKISEVLQVSELLQLNELQNFFGDECVTVARNSTSSAELVDSSKDTAFIHSVVLDQKTHILLRLSNGTLKSYPVAISATELAKNIDRLRYTLENISTDEYLAEAQKIYDLLIRPMADDLAQANPKTLVFVNDGVLRNIPMAALHDGKQFLIEKYAVATTLGLNLTPNNTPITRNAKAAIFGLSVEIPPFAPLPNVKFETEGLEKILGGKRFIDKEFTLANLQKQIDKNGYPIIHLATHGKFGADTESTFLQLYDQRVSLNEFEAVLRRSKKPIDLLTLSACQTAAGDSRATLGLAGVALRAGVQSTLATLWFVNDADTVPLIQNFYKQIQKPGVNKAEALRTAQLKIINDANGHPAIWSPFVLVGNWQ
ncbi:TPR repeat-containing protein [Calothrix sp. NIES-4071]|nr:TPR repeat-containing protein [Calothrix sp. NIES-4071]BAZ63020.1 TPR repeat-containing protein [Calothrix sp. NIES-4105]